MGDKDIAKLFERVRLIVATNQAENFKQGKEFNIFRIQGIASDEVKTCRFIRELLDPKGSHGQGTIFLQNFMEEVIKVDKLSFSIDDYKNARVVCEEQTSEMRRIDIVIRIQNRIFPIEVKIYAKDQDEQCFDYYKYVVEKDPGAKVYYLTLDGHEPSEKSKGKLSEGDYICLSFDEDIIRWLNNCVKMQEIEQIYSVREIIIQFRNSINELTCIHREKYEMAIKDMIEESYDNVVAAMQIAKVLSDVKADKMREIFRRIDKYIKELGFNLECIEDFEEKAGIFYSKNKKNWPSLNYVIPVENDKFKGKFVLRFEIEERLYFGVCNWSGKDNYSVKHSEDKKIYVKEKLTPKKQDIKDNDIWYWWRYLNEDRNVNFRYCNSGYEKLFDSEVMEDYMKSVYELIDETIKSIL